MTALTIALYLLTLFPLLAAGSPRAVGWRIVGSFLVLLGAAAAIPEWHSLAGAPAAFVAISAGFVHAGLLILVLSFWFLRKDKERLLVGRLGGNWRVVLEAVTLFALIFISRQLWPLVDAAGWKGAIAGAGLLGSGAVIFTLLEMVRVAKGWKWLDDRWLTRWSDGTPALLPGRTRLKGALALLSFAIALAVPHLIVAITGTVLGAFLLHDALRPSGKVPRWGLQPFILLVALSGVAWFTWTIAGPELPLTPAGLAEVPFSEAAEMLLAPMLGLAAWTLLGLWPLHGTGPASALTFLGGLFLIRWGTEIIPAGMEHIAPLSGIVAVLASFHAASRRRSGEYAAALGVLAVAPSGIAAWPFFILGSVPATLWIVGKRSPVPGLDRHQLVGVALIPALAWALPTMLRGETVLTVVALVAGVALFLTPSE